MNSIPERVAAGAAWLDEVKPGWERLVDLSALDLGNCCRCVLGQVFAVEAASFEMTGFDWGLAFDVFDDVANESFGFDAYNGEFVELDEAWIALLKERHEAGVFSDS